MEMIILDGIVYEVHDTAPKGPTPFPPGPLAKSPLAGYTLYSNGGPQYLFDESSRRWITNPRHRWALVGKK